MALVFQCLPVTGRPVYDPFLQKFQVGEFSDPEKLKLASGFPDGLFEPAFLDTVWTTNALEILSQPADSNSAHLSLRLLAAMGNTTSTESWVKWHRLRVSQLVAWPGSLSTDGTYLLTERLTMGFFKALQNDNLEQAGKLAERLKRKDRLPKVSSRDRFIWDLRHRLLMTIQKSNSKNQPDYWTSMMDLGPFDWANAWALWTAHSRQQDASALAPQLNTRANAIKLAGLRKSWLGSDDLAGSSFPQEIKVALGARLLKKDQLKVHLAKNPNPPQDFTLQGWWVSGQRTSRRGQADFYEQLGRTKGLKPGWRMDLFRRASEIHLLNGRWEPGVRNLQLSLDLAAKSAGTSNQRWRLRQWNEQALVLALAKGRIETARKLKEMGKSSFQDKEQVAFLAETIHWDSELGLDPGSIVSELTLKESARQLVRKGSVLPVKPLDSQKQDFMKAAASPQWDLWAKWGLGLVPIQESSPIEVKYRNLLESCRQERDPQRQNSLVVEAVALMLNDRLEKEALLRWVLDKDIHHRSDGRSLIAMSPFSALAKKKLNDSTALHAMLGLALLVDDLRGIVGVATPMPTRGLTNREKLCFLYPLPRDGAIHFALSAADNDPALLLAIARSESLYEPSVRSRAGALGWMQIMPFHFSHKGARPGVDNWSNARVSIAMGDRIVTENVARYGGNPFLTLAAYNAGPGATARWQKQLGDNTRDDIFLAWIGYPETRNYVEKVLIDRKIYDWIIKQSRISH